MLIEMIGKEWRGQEYDLGKEYNNEINGRVGFVNVVTGLWKNKGWFGYNLLAELLKQEGLEPLFLEMRPSIEEHIKELASCELIVCGDTLPMHLALALKKKVVALFNCTPPNEIYGQGRMVKIISPLLDQYFYQKEFDQKAIEAIPVEEVFSTVKKLLKA